MNQQIVYCVMYLIDPISTYFIHMPNVYLYNNKLLVTDPHNGKKYINYYNCTQVHFVLENDRTETK